MPSASIVAPSFTKVPNTRLVKKPRESLLTIGSLPSAVTPSKARATVSSSVCAPRMISTSFILRTGEKQCSPTNVSGHALAEVRPEIGKVAVFDANTSPGASIDSASRMTAVFSARCSNTASTIRSQPCRSATSAVVAIRFSRPATYPSIMPPFATAGDVIWRTASKP